MNKENQGIWTPNEIANNPNLDWSCKALLSLYMYYTTKGNSHCCMLTNDKIAEMLGVSERTVKRNKSKLKEKGFIDFNGGIKVWYKGCQSVTHNNEKSDDGQSVTHNIQSDDDVKEQKNGQSVQKNGQVVQDDGQSVTHNKESKKENNKESIIDNTSIDNTGKEKEKINKKEKINTIPDKKEKNYFNVHWLQLHYLLENANDELEVLKFLTDNPTEDNYNLIRQYWNENKPQLIKELDQLWNSLNRDNNN